MAIPERDTGLAMSEENAGGNRVVVLHQRGKTQDSDLWAEMDYGLVYTVEEGLIGQADFYATPEAALAAGGLSE